METTAILEKLKSMNPDHNISDAEPISFNGSMAGGSFRVILNKKGEKLIYRFYPNEVKVHIQYDYTVPMTDDTPLNWLSRK